MCIKEELFTSFIKGVGKTSGTITIFGFLGAAWYLYNKSTNYSLTKLFKNEEIILQELDEAEQAEQSKLESYIKALFAKYTIIDPEEKPEQSEQSEQSEQQTRRESEAIRESVLEKDKLKMSKSNKSQNFRKIFDNL